MAVVLLSSPPAIVLCCPVVELSCPPPIEVYEVVESLSKPPAMVEAIPKFILLRLPPPIVLFCAPFLIEFDNPPPICT